MSEIHWKRQLPPREWLFRGPGERCTGVMENYRCWVNSVLVLAEEDSNNISWFLAILGLFGLHILYLFVQYSEELLSSHFLLQKILPSLSKWPRGSHHVLHRLEGRIIRKHHWWRSVNSICPHHCHNTVSVGWNCWICFRWPPKPRETKVRKRQKEQQMYWFKFSTYPPL